MSNFICSECGMTNIDCGYAGYKTPKEIELEKENKRLQERLAIATKALNDIKVYSQRDWDEYNCMGCARKALKEIDLVGTSTKGE